MEQRRDEAGPTSNLSLRRLFHLDKSKPLFNQEGWCLKLLEQVCRNDPTGPLAEKALFYLGASPSIGRTFPGQSNTMRTCYAATQPCPVVPKAAKHVTTCRCSTLSRDSDGKNSATRLLVELLLCDFPDCNPRQRVLGPATAHNRANESGTDTVRRNLTGDGDIMLRPWCLAFVTLSGFGLLAILLVSGPSSLARAKRPEGAGRQRLGLAEGEGDFRRQGTAQASRCGGGHEDARGRPVLPRRQRQGKSRPAPAHRRQDQGGCQRHRLFESAQGDLFSHSPG